jgi:acetylornithine deacetylase/succinyl-diaminopimelate desuccinylase-like protein
MDKALRHLEQNRDRFLGLLLEYLRIPSVSAQRAHDADSRRAAEFIRTALAEAGFETGLSEGKGLPTVHGARRADRRLRALRRPAPGPPGPLGDAAVRARAAGR